jgi:hypothetical protein
VPAAEVLPGPAAQGEAVAVAPMDEGSPVMKDGKAGEPPEGAGEREIGEEAMAGLADPERAGLGVPELMGAAAAGGGGGSVGDGPAAAAAAAAAGPLRKEEGPAGQQAGEVGRRVKMSRQPVVCF